MRTSAWRSSVRTLGFQSSSKSMSVAGMPRDGSLSVEPRGRNRGNSQLGSAPQRFGHSPRCRGRPLRFRRRCRPAFRRLRQSRRRGRTPPGTSGSGTTPGSRALRGLEQQRAIADHGLEFFAQLHRDGLRRALEREQASAGFDAHAKHRTGGGAASSSVVSRRQSSWRRRPRRGAAPVAEHRGARGFGVLELSLISRSSVAVMRRTRCTKHSGRTKQIQVTAILEDSGRSAQS